MAQAVKNLLAMQETWLQSLDWEDPLEKGMAIHSSILAWRIPWIEKLGGYSSWGRKESDRTEQLTLTMYSVSWHGVELVFFLFVYNGPCDSSPM